MSADKFAFILLPALTIALCICCGARAQLPTLQLDGAVTDFIGLAQVDANVEVEQIETGYKLCLTSSPSGEFRFSNLPVSTYRLAGDEEDAVGIEGAESVVIVAAVEDHDVSWLETQGAGAAAFVNAAFGGERIGGLAAPDDRATSTASPRL